jgi:hypothetical protein
VPSSRSKVWVSLRIFEVLKTSGFIICSKILLNSLLVNYGNWFDDEKYDEQHQKWRGKPKIIGGNNES